MRTAIHWACGGFLILASCAAPAGATVLANLQAGAPLAPGVMTLSIFDASNVPLLDIAINIPGPMPPLDTAQLMAAMINPLLPAFWDGDDGVLLPNLPAAAGPVQLATGATAQDGAGVSTPAAERGRVQYAGVFEPFDVNHQPAVFTAGIVTDVGELTARISAEELNFQTDGPIICQALFQRLAPRAPQYGAQINYAGDRLEVYFDPAYTVTQGGIIFGTTSPSQGASGVINPVIPPVPGDANGDGFVDIFDINLVSESWGKMGGPADVNMDGIVDIFDINFISERWDPPPAPSAVPEPGPLALLIAGALTAIVARRRVAGRSP